MEHVWGYVTRLPALCSLVATQARIAGTAVIVFPKIALFPASNSPVEVVLAAN